MVEINQRLAEVSQEREQLQRQARLLAEVTKQLKSEQARLMGLERRLRLEQRDVDNLEGASLSSLFHSMLGDKDMRLVKEREEYLRAKLQFDEATHAVNSLKEEQHTLESQVQRLPAIEAAYVELIGQKEANLQATGMPPELKALGERISAIGREKRELQEATLAGQDVLNALADVRKSLDSAAGWGVWDMVGGGLLATMAKHSNMDKAREHAHRAEQALRRFHRELQDVAVQISLNLQMDGFIRFADYFFDGLIVDWTVQNQINRSRESVAEAERQVKATLARLQSREQAVMQEEQTVIKEREGLLARL